jgi:superfamily II DNA or RNA helicase
MSIPSVSVISIFSSFYAAVGTCLLGIRKSMADGGVLRGTLRLAVRRSMAAQSSCLHVFHGGAIFLCPMTRRNAMNDFSLWGHQAEGIDKLRASIRSGKRRAVLQAPPGSGKTETACTIIKFALGKGKRVGFTVPLLNLVNQTVDRFELRGVSANDIGVMQAAHERTDEQAAIQVISCQTLQNRAFPLVDIAIIDECHIRHAVIKRWMDECPKVIFIGLSATPWAKGMREQWDDNLIVVETIHGLIEKGILSKYRTFVPSVKPDLSNVKLVAGEYHEGQLSDVMSDDKLVGDVVTTWSDKARGRPTLAFCVDRAHAQTVTDEFRKFGIKAAYVDANTEMDERAEYIEGLEGGSIEVVVSIGTMTTGVDIPCVSCISYVRPTRSPMLFVQSLARGLRAYPGKTDCLILDHSTTSARLGLIGDIGFDRLKSGKKEKPVKREDAPRVMLPRECKMCHYIVPPRQRECPNCGAAVKLVSGIRCEDGELVEYSRTNVTVTKDENGQQEYWTYEKKRRFYAELLGFAETRNFNRGWAYHVYIDQFPGDELKFRNVEPAWPVSQAVTRAIRRHTERYRRERKAAG